MSKYLLIFILLQITVLSLVCIPVVNSDAPDTDPKSIDRGFAIVMSNGTTLKVTEYAVDIDRKTVFFKSKLSGLSATFPLERITRVVFYDNQLDTVPDDAMPLFIPEKTVNEVDDDGGIPVLFNVTRTVVGSGAASGYSRAGGDRSGDYRQSYTPARTSSQSSAGAPTQDRRPSTTPPQTRPSNNRSPSSNSTADNFFNALFGGGR
jgi:hypothetical protein